MEAFPYATLVLAVLVALTLAICILILFRIREIDRSTRALAVFSSDTRRELMVLFQQIQALAALEKTLHLQGALPSMRGWAASPDFLLRLTEEIERRRPRIVLECGSGVSTVVCARMLQLAGAGHVYSLEHEAGFAEQTRALLVRHGLEPWATVVNAPLDNAGGTPWYSEKALPAEVTNIELFVVDGPPSTVAPLARYPALPRMAARLSKNALIIVDDAARNDEREILLRWAYEFPEYAQVEVECEKGCALLTRREATNDR